MITAALISGKHEWAEQVRSALARYAAVFDVEPDAPLGSVFGHVPVDIVALDSDPLTDKVITTLRQIQDMYPNSVTVCVATAETAERARLDDLLAPDFWLIVPAAAVQLHAQLEPIVAFVTAGGRRALPSASGTAAALRDASEPAVREEHGSGAGGFATSGSESSLYRLIKRLASGLDLDELFTAYCDAVQEATRCVSYCLLWRSEETGRFTVVRAEGLAPLLQRECALAPADPLPACLQRSRGIITRESLSPGPEGARVLRELEMLGGVMAAPLFCQAALRGIMAVGPKVIGGPYTTGEAEGLFMLSSSAAAAAAQTELHQQLEARNKYIGQVLSTMESGVITLGMDAKIRVCNPYAAAVLARREDEVVGRDIRALPSPLGDYLHACLTHGEERSAEELGILANQVILRISTRRLMDARGVLIGSMMLLEDITAERALTQERRKAERNEVITQIVARVAHELKNPLATVYTFAELMPDKLEDPEFQHLAELVRRDVHRLDDLVTKLMSLSESPGSDQQVVQIPEILRLAILRVEQLDEAAVLRIVSMLSADLPMVRVDPNVMAAAISHLLRFGLGDERGQVTVEAKLQNSANGERPVAIVVRAPRDPSLEDDPAALLDPSYVLEHPEIDLGPSASQRMIESQGGALEVYCEDGSIYFRVLLTPYPDPARM